MRWSWRPWGSGPRALLGNRYPKEAGGMAGRKRRSRNRAGNRPYPYHLTDRLLNLDLGGYWFAILGVGGHRDRVARFHNSEPARITVTGNDRIGGHLMG